jgi:hypothetical protein
MAILKNLWDNLKWVLSALISIFIYEKLIRPKQEPKTVINNDNSSNVAVGKIKKTSGINEMIAMSKNETSNDLKELQNSPNKKIQKQISKIEDATLKGKPKKVERIQKRVNKKLKVK